MDGKALLILRELFNDNYYLSIMKITECIAAEKSQAKKNYKSPSMVCYGAVRELTQNGGSGPSENNSAAGCVDTTHKSNPACNKP